MSTFSSVVNKSGKKFAPKATARRKVSNRAPDITLTPSDQTATQLDLPPTQDAANPSGPLQAQSATEEDAASSNPPAHTLQPDNIATPLSIVIQEADSVTGSSQLGELPRVTNQARKDATIEHRTPNQGEVNLRRAATRESQAQPTFVKSGEVAHQQSVLGETSHEQDTNFREQAPSPGPSTRSHKSRKGGAKRKSDSQAIEIPDAAAASFGTVSAPEVDASTHKSAPRKRQKLDRKRPTPASVTVVTQDISAISGEAPNELPAAAAAAPQSGETTASSSRPIRKRRAKKTMEQVAAEIVADAVGESSGAAENSTEGTKRRKRRWKWKIPEGAEDHEIAPSEVKMADLVKDTRLGKGSKLEARLQEIDWDEVKKKRKEAEEEAEKQRELEREEKRTGRSARQDDVPAASTVPKLTLRDGQVVMEEESRIVDRHAEIEQGTDEPVKVLDVDDVTRRVNQSTIGRQLGVKHKGHWNDEMTDLFYKGLRMFGTDFMMISKMFPGLSRRHIKLKYTREERTNLTRVHNNLIAKEDVDMEEYSQMSNQVYEDPERIHEELRADEKRLRDEDVARRAREAEAANPNVDPEDGNVLQSREQGTAEPAGSYEAEMTVAETESSAKENRFESVARSIVQRATAPKKVKKSTAPARKRERKKRTGLEGTEEVVGSIDDV